MTATLGHAARTPLLPGSRVTIRVPPLAGPAGSYAPYGWNSRSHASACEREFHPIDGVSWPRSTGRVTGRRAVRANRPTFRESTEPIGVRQVCGGDWREERGDGPPGVAGFVAQDAAGPVEGQ
ncbi:hypothetical protein TPA0908_40310 [Micromonospora sp. AKA38]|nr:hypothetical protein TPA0908_40310 [Micromonospora sp. AKA38]